MPDAHVIVQEGSKGFQPDSIGFSFTNIETGVPVPVPDDSLGFIFFAICYSSENKYGSSRFLVGSFWRPIAVWSRNLLSFSCFLRVENLSCLADGKFQASS